MAREKKTPGQVIAMAAELILAAGIRGLTPGGKAQVEEAARGERAWADYLGANYERAWAVGIDLTVRVRPGRGIAVSVGWSGTGRSMSEARAAIALYAQVVDLGCELEAALGGYEVVAD